MEGMGWVWKDSWLDARPPGRGLQELRAEVVGRAGLGGQRAEESNVDGDGLGPIGAVIIPAAVVCPSPGQDTQSLSRI